MSVDVLPPTPSLAQDPRSHARNQEFPAVSPRLLLPASSRWRTSANPGPRLARLLRRECAAAATLMNRNTPVTVLRANPLSANEHYGRF